MAHPNRPQLRAGSGWHIVPGSVQLSWSRYSNRRSVGPFHRENADEPPPPAAKASATAVAISLGWVGSDGLSCFIAIGPVVATVIIRDMEDHLRYWRAGRPHSSVLELELGYHCLPSWRRTVALHETSTDVTRSSPWHPAKIGRAPRPGDLTRLPKCRAGA